MCCLVLNTCIVSHDASWAMHTASENACSPMDISDLGHSGLTILKVADN